MARTHPLPMVESQVESRSAAPAKQSWVRRPERTFGVTVGIPLVYLAVSLIGLWWIDIRPAALAEGLEDIASLIARMVPPTTGPLPSLVTLIAETLLIAVAGTGLAALASVALAAGASSRYTGPRVLQLLCRVTITVTRAVPTLVFAIVFVRIFGLGPLAGALAVAVHSIGMIGKMMADTFEELSSGPTEAISATGATRLQCFISTTLTRSLPRISSFVLYRLDINIRASAVLGLVGAGGIGVALQTALGSLNYPRAAGIIVTIIGLLLILEMISYFVQQALTEHVSASSRVQLFSPSAEPAKPAWTPARAFRALASAAATVLFAFSLSMLSVSGDRLARAGENAWNMAAGFFPPVFSLEIAYGILESVLMAFTATVFGVTGGLVIAVLSTGHLLKIPLLGELLRLFVVIIRGIPEIIYALIFVAALGLGPFAGFLALAISCTALGAKFFTDTLQNIDPTPVQALEAVGASRLQAFVAGVWPQFVPSFIGNSLFTSDLALRESAVLGIVGAGGIGFILHESVSTVDYQSTAGVLIGLVVVVASLEHAARWARRKVL